MTYEELAKEERELLKRLAQIRREKSKLTKKAVEPISGELETMTKAQLIQTYESLSEIPLSEADKRQTKKALIECIARRKRLINSARAFARL